MLQREHPNDKMKERLEKARVEGTPVEEIDISVIKDTLKQMVQPTHIIAEYAEKMMGVAEQITNMSNINNVMNNKNVQQPVHNEIHVVCPGVTKEEVARQLPDVLNQAFSGFHNYTDQMSRVR